MPRRGWRETGSPLSNSLLISAQKQFVNGFPRKSGCKSKKAKGNIDIKQEDYLLWFGLFSGGLIFMQF